jgi:tRNA threonylcarbamoyl adenosine modification protein YeaZ
MLLAIDTSAASTVAIVDRDRGVLAERSVADTMRHAEVVGDLISGVIADAGIEIGELSAVAAGMGPGPFTGLRVGIAAARAFAFGADRPLVPLVSHDAIAFAAYRAGSEGPLLVVTDARRREVYWSRYTGADEQGLPMRAEGPALCRPADLPYADLPRQEMASVSAGELGMLAELTYAAHRAFADDVPLYLRSPDVTPAAAPKRVTG